MAAPTNEDLLAAIYQWTQAYDGTQDSLETMRLEIIRLCETWAGLKKYDE